MSLKRILYVLFVVVVAGFSALTGALAGGTAVYQATRQANPAHQTISAAIPANNASSGQTFTLDMTDIQTTITQAAHKVGPTVVTVVGTLPSQISFFSPTSDQTISGSGVFVSVDGYILTNNHIRPLAKVFFATQQKNVPKVFGEILPVFTTFGTVVSIVMQDVYYVKGKETSPR